jgi:DNA (cytosine-5)-methyltransferase 1
MRERLVFVGLKSREIFSFPEPYLTLEDYVSCEDAIGDLPSRESELGDETDTYCCEPITEYQRKMRGVCDILFNHVATNHTQPVRDVIALVPEGGNYKDLPEGVGTSRKFNEAWTRYHSKRPSRTIDTGHRNHFHYKYNRVPTIRENARLQSFTDDFVFVGTRTQQNRQVGNAVPPLLGEAIAIKLLEYLGAVKK